jgi:hypothetical protein
LTAAKLSVRDTYAKLKGLVVVGSAGDGAVLSASCTKDPDSACFSGLPVGLPRSTSETLSRSESSVALTAFGRLAGLFVLVIGSTLNTRPETPSVNARK